jgi:predicted Zn finger-like uncharacterized protein
MILTCPNCQAQFMISASALGEAGRTVRCSKCAHQWHAAPVRDSLDGLKTLDVKDDTVRARTAEQEAPAFLKSPPPQAHTPKAPSDKKEIIITPRQRQVAGILTAAAIILLSVWGLVGLRHYMPALNPFFVTLGWYDVVPEANLVFERPNFVVENGKQKLSVNVINLGTKGSVLPSVNVRFYKGRQLVAEEIIRADQDKINPESSVSVVHTFDRLPTGITELRFSFVTPE